ncbi:lytic transglycosylase domain-containing protein [Nocardioides sp.]|uniref:lytic transglycosylase domain-containing protein n=1 Tax=Nocardioides sp. TaxID=35761 RepID=UPI0027358780|nr:lytic murein transglycosylase [Nocardioides sp.]MDP3890392.1 lytic murein transglycosylase [Nocardioides sp.]
MSTSRFSRVQKVTAFVPLALLSTAWTASLVGVAGVGTVAVAADPSPSLPDGTSVPTQAIEAPASVTTDGVIAPSVRAGDAANVVRTASTNGIPSAALAAYQRAEAVINAADKACNISWQLIAAIGRVESDHGRYGGNTLDDDGVAQPGIYGVALDGTGGTRAIPDTDAGQYDNDTVWDRAVGPMQFIPSTWSIVGVDADGDGVRNPQDIDDAALAAAVYLCSGNEDLSGTAGQRKAVFRYNRSNEYVDLVLSVMEAYTSGDFTSVPNSTTSAAMFTQSPTVPAKSQGQQGQIKSGQAANGKGNGAKSGGTSTGGSSTPAPAPTAPAPTAPSGPSLPGTGGSGGSEPDKVTDTVKKTVKKVEDTVKDPVGEVTNTLTWAEAQLQCLASGLTVLQVAKLEACIANLLK